LATRGWMGGASQTAAGAWPETSPIRFSETPFKRLPCSLAFKCHKTRHLAAVCQVAHRLCPENVPHDRIRLHNLSFGRKFAWDPKEIEGLRIENPFL
jgi:hypothetical protein